mmetsp:Transcript_80795/g.142498  ORF Transcript_80795/g.142498 Transcript_80795/m.142498 type:complete len:163 (+) Transcript_80795:83-571(+)
MGCKPFKFFGQDGRHDQEQSPLLANSSNSWESDTERRVQAAAARVAAWNAALESSRAEAAKLAEDAARHAAQVADEDIYAQAAANADVEADGLSMSRRKAWAYSEALWSRANDVARGIEKSWPELEKWQPPVEFIIDPPVQNLQSSQGWFSWLIPTCSSSTN